VVSLLGLFTLICTLDPVGSFFFNVIFLFYFPIFLSSFTFAIVGFRL